MSWLRVTYSFQNSSFQRHKPYCQGITSSIGHRLDDSVYIHAMLWVPCKPLTFVQVPFSSSYRKMGLSILTFIVRGKHKMANVDIILSRKKGKLSAEMIGEAAGN